MKKATKKQVYATQIMLPSGEVITPGPGTIPTAEDSVKKTDIKKMIKAAKEASEAGVFDKEEDYGVYIPFPTK